MIFTLSKFYYGHTITIFNQNVDFKEGVGADITAVLDIGTYTLTDFVTELARALNAAGSQTYTVTVVRSTRIITVTAGSAFTLLASTGTNLSTSAYSLIGFSTDTSSATSHAATSASGSEWKPQFKPQDFVTFEDQQSPIDGSIKQSTSGQVEAVRFGTKKIMDANFRFITDTYQGSNSPIENQASALSNARAFMVYATTKADLEFMPDRSDTSTFTSCILESTPEDKDGLAFKLKELYGQGLVGYYETGILKFREL